MTSDPSPVVHEGHLYRHYLGEFHEVIGVAIHKETMEKLVVYRSEHGQLYVRSLALFCGQITKRDGTVVDRFEHLCDAATARKLIAFGKTMGGR